MTSLWWMKQVAFIVGNHCYNFHLFEFTNTKCIFKSLCARGTKTDRCVLRYLVVCSKYGRINVCCEHQTTINLVNLMWWANKGFAGHVKCKDNVRKCGTWGMLAEDLMDRQHIELCCTVSACWCTRASFQNSWRLDVSRIFLHVWLHT